MQRYDSYKDSGVKWLGEIPSHWEVKHLRNFLTLFSEKGHANSQLLSVTREKGVILRDKENKEENHNYVPDDLSGYKHLNRGDFVINKMKSWQGSYGVSDYDGIVSPAYFTCKLRGVNPKFFSRAIRSKAYVGFFMQYSKGIRVDQWDLDPNSMKDIPFILPLEDEQEAIAKYLDAATSKIDEAIAQQQKMIDLLNERKQIIINNAVTKGLDPNVKMKPSGIDWIGDIPEHWEVVKNKYLFKESDERNTSLKYPLLSFSKSKGIVLQSEISDRGIVTEDLTKYKVLHKGQLLENRLQAWNGMFGTSYIEGCVSPDYSVFIVDEWKIDVSFASYLFRTPMYVEQWVIASKGIGTGFNRLYTPQFNDVPCICPPIKEQKDILCFVNAKTKSLNESIERMNKMIDLLQERKQIIINDVVTGKVKVI